MPITILDYVKSVIGEKDTYTEQDFSSACVEMLGGCEICGATIAAYSAYPSRSGYWRCADCVRTTGFTTVEAFTDFQNGVAPDESDLPDDTGITLLNCPACGGVKNIYEIWEYTFKCGDCGSAWRL